MTLNTLDDYIKAGFFISFSADKDGADELGNPARWYCEMYLGDETAPWKPGTTHGEGYGNTQAECFENCKHALKTK